MPKLKKHHVQKLRTPQTIQRWIYSLDYNKADTMRTLPGVIETNMAHCLEGAMAAAAILESHGYPPLILDLESTDNLDHTLFLFQENGKFGSVGMSHDVGLHGRKPIFSSLEDLVRSYAIPYIDRNACITGYGTLDLRELNGRWRSAQHNVWFVEDALRNIRHTRLTLSPTLVNTWRQRFIEFDDQFPDRQPNYFPRQHEWL